MKAYERTNERPVEPKDIRAFLEVYRTEKPWQGHHGVRRCVRRVAYRSVAEAEAARAELPVITGDTIELFEMKR